MIQKTACLLISIITFLLPISIVLYALAPIIVFAQLLFSVLIFWPYKIITATLDAIYPLYVFVGVSCIVGAIIGASGKYVALAAISATMPPDGEVMVVAEKLVKEEESA